jgi:hypothetical protein
MINRSGNQQMSLFAGVALLLVRGLLLWLVIPIASLVWIVLCVWLLRKGVGLGKFLGWVDLNLMAFLQRSILRPSVPSPVRWIPVRDMPEVKHRIRLVDPL